MSKRVDHPNELTKKNRDRMREATEDELPIVDHGSYPEVQIKVGTPSYEKWASYDFWTEMEALFLIFSFRPFKELTDSEKELCRKASPSPEREYYDAVFSQYFTEEQRSQFRHTQELIRRANLFTRWRQEINPLDFVNWALKKGLNVPPELVQAVKEFHGDHEHTVKTQKSRPTIDPATDEKRPEYPPILPGENPIFSQATIAHIFNVSISQVTKWQLVKHGYARRILKGRPPKPVIMTYRSWVEEFTKVRPDLKKSKK